MEHANELDMTSGPLLKKIIVFTIPILLSGVLQLLFNAADIIVVGNFAGDNAMAAVGSTASLVSLMTNLFIGISAGANVAVANFYGSKDDEAVQETVHTSVILSVVGGAGLMLIGLLLARPILELMGSPEAVLPLSALYLRIFFLGMPGSLLFNFCASILRATGDTKHPLYYLSVAGILNVVLNLFFVIVLNMSVAGVALATIISQYVSAFLIVRRMARLNSSIRIRWSKLRVSKSKLLRILRVGIPAGIQSSLFALSNVVIQSAINSFGEVVMAANTASTNIEGFVYIAMNSVYQAAMNFSGQNYGAGRYKRLHKVLFECLGLVTFVGLVLGGGAYLCGRPLLHIYTDSAMVITFGLQRMEIICLTYFLCGWMDTIVGVMRGMGYGIMPMLVSLVGSCLFRILWVQTIFQVYHTLPMLYISWPITWVITFLMHVVCYCGIWVKHRKDFVERIPAEPSD
ncbi:MAG: MATE family efflux transporter [Oscillospiraceae bacterium]|nr:MATE family efflux transporter [Oscillospiraceae bacterium]